MIRYLVLIGMTFFLLLFSCKKDRVENLFEVLDVAPDNEIRAIAFPTSDTAFAVGGKVFDRGIVLSTTDAGVHWKLDSLNDKILNGLDFPSAKAGWIAGFNGYLYQSKPMAPGQWDFFRLPVWNQFVDVCASENNLLLTISAVGFVEGIIHVWNPDLSLDTSFVFPYALTAIDAAPDGILLVCGYGAILRSEDQGQSWIRNPVDGDFFQDIQFPSAEVGYAVGYAGTILKTTNGGVDWEVLRNGGSLWVPDQRFKCLYFSSPETGVLAGEDGLIWRTHDGGDHWEVLKNAPEYDYLDVVLIPGGGWLGTRDGKLVKFVD
ncbi:MAG: hypothetical protein KDC34_10810 [Saprospiraceae bacterium]|nr:hypothetical protein [Saprospiraceae bacterium]